MPAGKSISVYASDGHMLLYSYTTAEANSPTVISGDQMNTGNTPFTIGPVYISYSPSGDGTTTFYSRRAVFIGPICVVRLRHIALRARDRRGRCTTRCELRFLRTCR